jgi:hypothetical protein
MPTRRGNTQPEGAELEQKTQAQQENAAGCSSFELPTIVNGVRRASQKNRENT